MKSSLISLILSSSSEQCGSPSLIIMADSTAAAQHEDATAVSIIFSSAMDEQQPNSITHGAPLAAAKVAEEEEEEEKEEDSDVQYESDYTYDASDDDNDDEKEDASIRNCTSAAAAAASAAHESLVGKKRAACKSPPACSKPAPTMAKIALSVAVASAASVPRQQQQQQHRPDLVLGSQCLACHGERHDPVMRCEQVQNWKRRRHEFWTVSTDILQRCVEQYIQRVAERDFGMNGDVAAAGVLCRTNRWRVDIPLEPPRQQQQPQPQDNGDNNGDVAPGAANHDDPFVLLLQQRQQEQIELVQAWRRDIDNNHNRQQQRLRLRSNSDRLDPFDEPLDPNTPRFALLPTLPETATATATTPRAAAGAAPTGKQESGQPALSDNLHADDGGDRKMAAIPTKPKALSFPTAMSDKENDTAEQGANQKKAVPSPAVAIPIQASMDSMSSAKADTPATDGAPDATHSCAPTTVNDTLSSTKIAAGPFSTATAASAPSAEEDEAATLASSPPKRLWGFWGMIHRRLTNRKAQTTNDGIERTAAVQGDAAEIGNPAEVEQEEKQETIDLTGTETQQKNSPGSVCTICFDDEVAPTEMHAMDCGHAFCRDCWRDLVGTMLSETHETAMLTHCPATGCETSVNEVLVKAVAPEYLPIFENHQRYDFVQCKRDWVRFCPGPDCDQIAIRPRADLFEDIGANFLCGKCQTHFCFTCGRVPHQGVCEPDVLAAPEEPPEAAAAAAAPMRMQQGMEGNQLLDARDDKKRKHCPKCSVLVEKTGGCNRMICRCRHAFCWLCLGDYVSYGGHFCGQVASRLAALGNADRGRAVDLDFLRLVLGNEPEDEEGKRVLQETKELYRFAHHYNRYYAHHQGQAFAERQCPCLADRQQTYTQTSGFRSFTETDFIQSANETLVASRRLLKYAYISVYHSARINEEDNEHSHLGFLHLERLERFTEELSGVSENALTRHDRTKVLSLISVVIRCMTLLGEFEFLESVARSKSLDEI